MGKGSGKPQGTGPRTRGTLAGVIDPDIITPLDMGRGMPCPYVIELSVCFGV